jgi:hypothetical protein
MSMQQYQSVVSFLQTFGTCDTLQSRMPRASWSHHWWSRESGFASMLDLCADSMLGVKKQKSSSSSSATIP